MCKKWLKHFELEGEYQVLAMREYNEEEDHHECIMITQVEGIKTTMTVAHESEERIDKYFDRVDEKEAKDFLERIGMTFTGGTDA